jgi:hypothetical protein
MMDSRSNTRARGGGVIADRAGQPLFMARYAPARGWGDKGGGLKCGAAQLRTGWLSRSVALTQFFTFMRAQGGAFLHSDKLAPAGAIAQETPKKGPS